ncbi:MAG TPA: VPDSG-CTERM sorting domain-containing protein [Chthoniobacterales bacterium]
MGDAHELGFVEFGIPSGDADRTAYVQAMVDLPMGGSTVVTISGQDNTVTRSLNDFGPLADPVFAFNGTSTTIDLGTVGYDYLFAKYDGPNFGSEVWYVGDLSGVITIPANGLGDKYGLSGWTLFTGQAQQTPEGGSTVALLGLALAGVAIFRARLLKA